MSRCALQQRLQLSPGTQTAIQGLSESGLSRYRDYNSSTKVQERTWVNNVVCEVFQGTHAGHDSLARVAEHGHHSQSAPRRPLSSKRFVRKRDSASMLPQLVLADDAGYACSAQDGKVQGDCRGLLTFRS